MKFIAAVMVALAVSAQADDHDYSGYQTNYDHTYQDLAAYQGYDQSGVASAFNSIAEKQDDLDMDTILPIVVFGGLGLGALAYVDSLNRYNTICNKLNDITSIARGSSTAATLVDAGTNVANEAALNTLVESNRVFLNSLAAIDDLNC